MELKYLSGFPTRIMWRIINYGKQIYCGQVLRWSIINCWENYHFRNSDEDNLPFSENG